MSAPITTFPRWGGGLVVLDAEALAARTSNAPWSATPAERSRTAHHVTRRRPDIGPAVIEFLWTDHCTGPARFRSRKAAQRAADHANRRT